MTKLLGGALVIIASVLSANSAVCAEKEMVNTIGMKFVQIDPGKFEMGQINTPLSPTLLSLKIGRGRISYLKDGDYDEKPTHTVKISKGFYMGVTEVTNYQYELFDPGHRKMRGKEGFSGNDDDAVVFVSWYDAKAFCLWLSEKEGLSYRLPTEAEWEYACRAGTNTDFYFGDMLPEDFLNRSNKNFKVGKTQPNGWGIYDMHGNVEEWCRDWYGPYPDRAMVNPVGHASGDYRVVRGGSHSTHPYYLRSANRMGALPNDRHWLMGFRVVLGEQPGGKPLTQPMQPHQKNVQQRSTEAVQQGPDPGNPYFEGPRKFVRIPKRMNGQVFAAHNHDPAIVQCDNGDLLTIWYSCYSESNRELVQAASRLRLGADQWETASLFWDVPDRNDHAPALWNDGNGKLYHFTGMSYGAGHNKMALVMRTSTDNAKTWSPARIIGPEYNSIHMPSEPAFRLNNGTIALVTDHPPTGGLNRSSFWFSDDEGLTWYDPGGLVWGIHGAVAQLKNGNIIGYGRIDYRTLPKSVSKDMGKSFTYSKTTFPPVGGGQRAALLRLQEGPLFLAGFADRGIKITDASGKQRMVYGLYAAISFDGGESWENIRLVSDDGPGRPVESTNGSLFLMSQRNAEHQGYLSVCQAPNGLIHLISSREHYAFNYKWLATPPPAIKYPPVKGYPVTETFSGPGFDAEDWMEYKGYKGGFNGKGQYHIEAGYGGISRIVGRGSWEMAVSVKNIKYHKPGSGASVIWLKDIRARWLGLDFKEDQLEFSYKDYKDKDTVYPLKIGEYEPGDWSRDKVLQGKLESPPSSYKIRMTWNEQTRRLRIFYGLNGSEPTMELPLSQKGLPFGKPLSESTAVYFIMKNGTMDLDNYEIRPLEN
ncbi:MAG: SUMF1/EgtB/PvdO family nonheme iron enzyme [Planctomycetota bacterium]|jgi:formylglycine-generating enzyme required for sulfatase activity